MPGGHLQNGKPVRRKKPKKKGKKGPRPEMAEKWPPKWKNDPKMGFLPFFSIFSISPAIFRPFQAGGHFPFFPFFSHFCTGPVSHSVDGHRARKPILNIIFWTLVFIVVSGAPKCEKKNQSYSHGQVKLLSCPSFRSKLDPQIGHRSSSKSAMRVTFKILVVLEKS